MSTRAPIRLQSGLAECGAACLATVLSYHKRHSSVREVSERCGVGRDGMSALAIVRAAREYGLRATAFSAKPTQLAGAPLPAIAHWQSNHFVVIEQYGSRGVHLIDPAVGRRKLTLDEFGAGFSGVLLTFAPDDQFQRRRRPRRGWLRALAATALLRQRGLLAQILLASLLLQGVGLLVQSFAQVLIDAVLPTRGDELLGMLGVGLALAGVLHVLLSYLRSATLLSLRLRVDRLLTAQVVGHLFSLPYRYFLQRGAGDLAQRSASVSRLRQLLSGPVTTALLDGPLAVGYLTIVLVKAPPLGFCLLGLATVQGALLLLTRRRRSDLNQASLSAQVQTQGQLIEAIKGVETLKAGGAEGAALGRWSRLFAEQLRADGRLGITENVVTSVLESMRLLAPAILLWVGGWQVLGGRAGLGATLTLCALAAAALGPITSLLACARTLQEAAAHVERLADILESEPEPKGRIQPRDLRGQIQLADVSYRHDPRAPWTLQQITVHIRPGEKIALVGRTGSGKSTLARLMLGLHEPTLGTISYDGISLDTLHRGALRRHFGVVTQEPHLFSGTIRENIALTRPEASLAEVVEAARLACVHDDIQAMPLGYDTHLSEGMGLSGGQRQRLALARALLGRPRVLLLDEATSHLDTVTEAQIEQHLSLLSQTRIIIAHRLSTVRDADQIFVIEDGRIAEHGRHADLMALGGHYSGLVAGQENTPSDRQEFPKWSLRP
ncbi:NHLP family bacteriocin export ABC transporter peptidase/permease/ATPase [Acrocarpospora pleiomorpha]|uniref:NHLP family bacteriocin export ABC transporter peptidase/permease/ATPase n=1 Tax=Acrocarpospora pleiomorpha TaxID=90975 RepID=A0A5M3XPC6_9ACTN|nr:peptidase domain-containing ABC transporter [Acrocarpospora pleiomorpha]GES23207.1 NHLP family bacteriocin export ABC transporter peptidase/permease/ATPase [Acrocarpospora pleiomorpha]